MKDKFLVLLLLFITTLGCTFSDAQDIAPVTTSYSPEPIPISTLTPHITLTIIPETLIPSYKGKPFSIVFIRNGNLWIANIGEKITERQLTFEIQGMEVTNFDVSPDETRIAYIPYRLEPLNSLIKLVDISTGDTSVILGENDPFSEIRVVWLDNSTIAYKNQDHAVPTFTTENVEVITKYIVYDLVAKKQLGITDFFSMFPSPNLHFQIGCLGGIDGCSQYMLKDLISNKQYKLEGKLGGFIGWSPDSQFMLFNTIINPDHICKSSLIMVNAQTLEQKVITAENKNVSTASFSSIGNFLFYKQEERIDAGFCSSKGVDYLVLNLETQEIYEIPINFQKNGWDVTWTPDNTHLVFLDHSDIRFEFDLWSTNLNGTDLQLIIPNVKQFEILRGMP